MKMQDAVGTELRYGSAASVALIILGLALLVANNGGGGYSLQQIASATSRINTAQFPLQDVAASLGNLDGLSFILLGLMVLVATPILRVAISVVAFAKERNALYTLITLIVLLNLLVALLVVPGLVG
ncbi:MAG: DUF1634 domain-containing protein [Candidatus Marsarchaeota archaeon]|nr:DUF1634 domain-containing protein [Candidatus Marsarchaeota archaeon]